MKNLIFMVALALAGCGGDPLEDAERSYFALKYEGVSGERLCEAARRVKAEREYVGLNYGYDAEASDEMVKESCPPS